MLMKPTAWAWMGALGAGLVLALSFVHPGGTVKTVEPTGPLLATGKADPQVLATFQRSCQDCHSNNTRWPAYSYVAPVSWLIEHDVRSGRKRLNLSQWAEYGEGGQPHLLSAIARMMESDQMPPPAYIFLHPEARLSDSDRQRIIEWTRQELSRLDAASEPRSVHWSSH